MIIWLTGPPGSGKSAVGAALARRMSRSFVDIDAMVEDRHGSSVAEVFERLGEDGFRDEEARAIQEIVASDGDESLGVVATGGGAVLRPGNRSCMAAHGIRVLLDVSREESMRRLSLSSHRPLLKGGNVNQRFNDLVRKREEVYADCDLVVDGNADVEVVVDRVLQSIHRQCPIEWRHRREFGNDIVRVIAVPDPYHAIRAARLCSGVNSRCFVVTDRNLYANHRDTIDRIAGNEEDVFVLEPGEREKSLDNVARIIAFLEDRSAIRSDVVVGFGGGVVTDVAGFVAAIYMRGTRFLAIPTSLLGMVDAAIGGKNGVNSTRIRNLLGTVRQPELVIECPSFLRTLPAREYFSGLVEALKVGFLAAPKLVNLVSELAVQHDRAIANEMVKRLIRRAVCAKLDVVGIDVHDTGARRSLNFGHTFAHAVEGLYPGMWTHGEAVAFGIVAAEELARTVYSDVDQRRSARVMGNTLPFTRIPDRPVAASQLIERIRLDKKRLGTAGAFVLLDAENKPVVKALELDDPRIASAIDAALYAIGSYDNSMRMVDPCTSESRERV